MKKIIVLFTTILVCGISNVCGQSGVTPAEKRDNLYLLIVTDYLHSVETNDGICNAFTDILIDGHSKLVTAMGDNRDKKKLDKRVEREMLLLKSFPQSMSIRIYAKDAAYNMFGQNGCSDGTIGVVVSDQTESLPINYCTLNSFSKNFKKIDTGLLGLGNDGVHKNEVKFNYRLIPLHTLTVPSSNGVSFAFLPTAEKVVLSAKTGFDSSLYHYQYRIGDSNTWIDISSNLYQADKLTVSAKDLFGDNYVQHINENIWFRVVSCYENGAYLSYSDPVALRVLLSAPNIVSTDSIPPTCHNGNDGKIVVNFDRQLHDKEKLYIGFKEHPDSNKILVEGGDRLEKLDLIDGKYSKTITGFEAKKYHIGLYGVYQYGAVGDTINTYTDGTQHNAVITVPEQPALSLDTVAVDSVNCQNGKDGRITVRMSGGTGTFTAFLTGDTTLTSIPFTSTYTFSGLRKGNYTFTAKDSNGCIYDKDGNPVEKNITIEEPNDVVYVLRNDIVQEPTAFGGSNGWAKVPYIGGSRPHTAEWVHSTSGAVYPNAIIMDHINNEDTTFVQNIPAGIYHVTVYDKKYAAALALDADEENICGCYDTIQVEVTEPPLLEVEVSEHHYVTCYGDSDGELLASATGGRPLETGNLPYKYEWYRYDSPTNPVDLQQSDSIARGLPAGTYRVKVSDKYGTLVWSEDFVLVQPDLFTAAVEVLQGIKCDGETTGSLKVSATGGTPPYTFIWDTDETTDVISNLSKGNYVVTVRDARYDENIEGHYCLAKIVGTISSPNPIELNAQVRELLCHDATDTEIILNVTGGVPPYSYLWNDGNTANSRTNLTSGTYSVTVTDAEGCFDIEEFVFENPELVIVDLGEDFTLCKNQTITVDGSVAISGATYQWTDANGRILSTEAALEISGAGKYRLLVTTADGCMGEDEIVVNQSDVEVLTDFVIPTTVARNTAFYAVNITQTQVDGFEWIFPDEAVVLDDSNNRAQLSFKTNGTYNIGLAGSIGFCNVTVYKSVEVIDKVQEDESTEAFLKRFIVYPNPNSGIFEASVELREASDYRLYLYDSYGTLIDTKDIRNSISETTNYNLPSVQPGLYMLRFVAAETVSIVKIIIQ